MTKAAGNSDAHTRVPNLVCDVVLPLLSGPEAICLLYIVRRTYGFADPNGGRKARDTIALSQFENGIVSGDRLLDLGTQLSRNTIKKALEGLEEKELVEVRLSCTNCYWEQDLNQTGSTGSTGSSGPSAATPDGSPRCPRCKATLSRSWALAPLTPRKLVDLLNRYDKSGRSWRWDKEMRKFRFESPDEARRERQRKADLEAERERLRELVWYPELVEELIALAAKQLASGSVSLGRQVTNFYKPVWELQEQHPSPPLIRYALEQTIKGPALRSAKNHRWFRYMQTVADNNVNRFNGKAPAGIGSEAETEAAALRERELKMRDLLRRAGELNGDGKPEQARALLSDILSQAKELAPLFGGDVELCETSLREAFKQGRSDFVGIAPNPFGLDLYPEWSWPADEDARSDAAAAATGQSRQ